MPKLNRSRIVNLRYNDDRRAIYNEIFDFKGGSHVLFNMENGVGKTVMIQFLMQPFIKDGSKRGLDGKELIDFFSGNSPTIVMHEIKLDVQNAEFLLIGMLLKASTDKDGKRNIKIIGFTNSYTSSNHYDIKSIPFTVEKNGQKTILSYQEAEMMLKQAQKECPNFKMYNFSDYTQKAKYFDKLEDYRISHKEWEILIRKINKKESGLSEMYDDCKTSQSLLVKEIIPVIEEKQNSSKNLLDELRNSLKKYIEMYQSEKATLDKLQLFENFILDSQKLDPFIEQYKLKFQDLKATEDTLSYLSKYISDRLIKLQDDIQEYKALKIYAEEDLKNIKAEDISFNIHGILDELRHIEAEINNIETNKMNLEFKEKKLNKAIAIQECSEEYPILIDKKKILAETKESIANLSRQDNEIQTNIKNYKFTLKNRYHEELLNNEAAKTDIISQLNDITNSISVNETALTKNNESQIIAKAKYDTNINIISSYMDTETSYKKEYGDFIFQKNLLGLYEDTNLKSYHDKLLANSDELNQELETLNNSKLPQIENSITDCKRQKNELEIKLNEIRDLLHEKEGILKLFNKATNELKILLRKHDLEEDVISNKEKLLSVIKQKVTAYNEKRDIINKEKFKLQKDLSMIENCMLFDIPDNLKHAMDDSGIEIRQGLQRLKSRHDSFEDKISLVRNNPMLPYSLLMSKEEMDQLSKLSENSMIPIPVMNENDIAKSVSMEATNNLYSIGDFKFYISFSEYLLDDDKRKSKISNLKSDIKEMDYQIQSVSDSIKILNQEENKVDKYPYRGNEDISLLTTIEELNNQKSLLNGKISDYDSQINNYEKDRKLVSERILSITKDISALKNKIDKFSNLVSKYKGYVSAVNDNSLLNDELTKLKNNNTSIVAALTSLRNTKIEVSINLKNCIADIETSKSLYEKFESSNEGEFIEGLDTTIIAGMLNACINNLSNDLKAVQQLAETLEVDILQKEKKLARISDNAHIDIEDYKNVKYSEHTLKTYILELNSVKEDLANLVKPLQDFLSTKSVKDNTLSNMYLSLKPYGLDEALPLKDIKDVNFKKRISDVYDEIADFDHELEVLETNSISLMIEINRLSQYIGRAFPDSVNLETMDIASLGKAVTKYLNMRDEQKQDIEEVFKEIRREFDSLERNYRDKHDTFTKALMQMVGEENPVKLGSTLLQLRDVLQRHIATEKEIRDNLKAFEANIINEIAAYSRLIYNDLSSIDKGSTIVVNGQRKRMLQIHMPDEENLNNDGIKIYIQNLIEEISTGKYTQNLDSILLSNINAECLLSELVGGLNRISIHVYKVEKGNLFLKDWKDISHKNSGAERFVATFFVFASLLAYTRRQPGDLENIKEGIILIMDNPFAKTQSEYLLKPMFSVAEKYNVQLLCFSGVSGSSIYNRFNVIYIAKVIKDKYSQKESLEFTGQADNTENETIEASSIYIQQQKLF